MRVWVQRLTVYVDDMRAPFGRMIMCHMIADTTAELLYMADRIGIARRWLQDAGTWKEHFDISLSKRALALAADAESITMRQLSKKLRERRQI